MIRFWLFAFVTFSIFSGPLSAAPAAADTKGANAATPATPRQPPPNSDAVSDILKSRGAPSGRSAAGSRGSQIDEPPPLRPAPR